MELLKKNESSQESRLRHVRFEVVPLVVNNQPIGRHRKPKKSNINEPFNDEDNGIEGGKKKKKKTPVSSSHLGQEMTS